VGVFSAQTGDAEGALQAFQRIIEVENRAIDATQAQLDQLNAQVAHSGGYGQVLQSATSRRNALQSQIDSARSQIHLSYRNTALVLREAGRTEEALQAAQQALTYASQDDQATIESLIADLKKRLNP
jgi:tetratricopeptide (TPR) repeat protein